MIVPTLVLAAPLLTHFTLATSLAEHKQRALLTHIHITSHFHQMLLFSYSRADIQRYHDLLANLSLTSSPTGNVQHEWLEDLRVIMCEMGG